MCIWLFSLSVQFSIISQHKREILETNPFFVRSSILHWGFVLRTVQSDDDRTYMENIFKKYSLNFLIGFLSGFPWSKPLRKNVSLIIDTLYISQRYVHISIIIMSKCHNVKIFLLPNPNLLVSKSVNILSSMQQKHSSAIKYILKVSNGSARKRRQICSKFTIKSAEQWRQWREQMPMTSFWCLCCYLWTFSTSLSSVSLVELEQVNVCRVNVKLWYTGRMYVLHC